MKFPLVSYGKAVGMVNGRVVVCGGYEYHDKGASIYDIYDKCYDYTPADGWVQIGNYPKAL